MRIVSRPKNHKSIAPIDSTHEELEIMVQHKNALQYIFWNNQINQKGDENKGSLIKNRRY